MPGRSPRTADPFVPSWLLNAWHSPWPWMALIVVLFCAPLFVGLTQQDFENDEAIYSFGVDTMLKDGDWLTPKSAPSESLPFLEKPPLKFWIVALPIKAGLMPSNEFGMRFWDAVMGSLALLYVFAIGRQLAGPVCGFAAVFFLFTHGPLVLTHGLRTNNMEAAVFLAYAAGIFHFLAWRASGPDDRRHVFAIAIYFVLGFMTKFVAALFLPVLLGMAVLVKAEDRLRLRFNWLTFALAGLLAAALIAPWFIYQQLIRPDELFATMFGQHVMKRFTVFLDPAHVHPWHYYLSQIWVELRNNGTAFLTIVGAALLTVQTARRRWLEGALVMAWFAGPLLLISFGTSKLYHYAYPFLPPVALAGGYGVAIMAKFSWRWLRRPAEAVAGARDRAWPRWLSSAPARLAFTAFGVAALILAVATGFAGRLRVAVGQTLLFRNASLARPMMAGALVLLAGGAAPAIRALVPVVLVIGVLPFSAYTTTIERSTRPDHPLQDVRACLAEVVRGQVAEGRSAPGVWVEAEGISHRFNYYLRGLGPWQQRSVTSDPTVATHLFVPAEYRPVLLLGDRYREFVARLSADAPGMLAKAAAHAAVSPEAMLENFRRTEVGVIRYDSVVLVLPGPYSTCATEQVRGAYR